jgi:energy-coupling factor transporter ATP-binding protein EcfA2
MSKSQSAMIIVEHNIARASEISTRLLKVKDGKLVNYDLQNHDLSDSITRGDEVVS